MLTAFFSSENFPRLLIYAVVFIAVSIPIACWRRESFVSNEIPAGDWVRLPGLFRLLWRPMSLLETTIGGFLAAAFAPRARRYSELAEISALPISARQVFACKFLCAPLVALVMSAMYMIPSFPVGIAHVALGVGVVLGWMLPSLALDSAAQLRQEEIVKSLPFAIDLMGSAMRAGLDFGASMRYYANLGTGGALEYEFRRVLREASLGKPMSESLLAMAGRVRIKTFSAFAAVVAYGSDIGASISDTLKVHGAEMRRERFSIAEQKAARAPSILIFPLAIFIMPAVFLVIFVPVVLQFISTQAK